MYTCLSKHKQGIELSIYESRRPYRPFHHRTALKGLCGILKLAMDWFGISWARASSCLPAWVPTQIEDMSTVSCSYDLRRYPSVFF